jgi:pyrimidine operon attenuation protein / uracil phosphoribosyltransferase
LPQPDIDPTLNAQQLETQLQKLYWEIMASFRREESLVVIGIHTRGIPLARRLASMLETGLGRTIPMGKLDIGMYRDDLSEISGSPILRATDIPFPLSGRTVVLVDDVIFTGRTIRAALDAILDHGRPRRVWLTTLVDRGDRELPIQPDFFGIRLNLGADQMVSVRVKEIDGEDAVLVGKKGE